MLPRLVTERTQPMRLADRMRHYRVPGLSVAVVDNGQLVWAQAWGVAQIGKPQPLTVDTLMQAASISKALTGIGALKLVEQGKLTLDADVNTGLRTWRVPPGAQTADAPVTLRRLLSHSAGLTVHGFRGYVPGEPLPSLTQMLDGLPPANNPAVRVDKVPGSEWRYSGGGFLVLQQLMVDVTGQPFAAWMQREVLAPAGMPASLFGDLPDVPLARASVGHEEGGRPIEGRRANHPELAAAGLWTTPSDLARLSLALQQTLAGRPSSLLEPATLAAALKPGLGPTGLGFFVEGQGERQRYGHDGRNAGFEAHWRFDARRAVIVMANANGAMPLIEEIVRAVAQVQGWADMQAQRVDATLLSQTYETTPLFLRGSMNEWGLATPLQRAARGRFVADVALPTGPVEFKFASEDWRAINIGAPDTGGDRTVLALDGPNIAFHVKTAGVYRFALDARDPLAPRYAVRRVP